MKKAILLTLSLAMCLSVVSCGNSASTDDSESDLSATVQEAAESSDSQQTTEDSTSEEEPEEADSTASSAEDIEELIAIGDTITTDYYEITLTSIGYADATIIPTEKQVELGSINSENLLLPMSKTSSDIYSESGYEILSATDRYKLLYFSFDYSFVGKEDVDYPQIFGASVSASYLDYSFSSSYYIAHRIVTDGETDNWHSLTSTSVIDREIAFYSPSSQHHPFEDYTMEARGFIAIPDEIIADESATIELSIDESWSNFHVTFSVDSQDFDNKLS